MHNMKLPSKLMEYPFLLKDMSDEGTQIISQVDSRIDYSIQVTWWYNGGQACLLDTGFEFFLATPSNKWHDAGLSRISFRIFPTIW